MRMISIPNAFLLAAAIAVGSPELALAQTSGADPHHPANSAQATQPSGMADTTAQGQGAMPGGSGMMQPGMMGQGQGNTMPMQCMMMQPGSTGGMPMQPGMMGGMPTAGMRGSMMKIMFAIADTDGDGALSFEEVTATHKRIFGSVDANKDGKVTPDEMQTFWRP
ncbi:EF-hand domain-containing protein [Rhizobium aegyptiacum]|uniref:EF-hand domain-containing protein n=1 Tax=Rhizobium aegyptiacum TaxID=1764550 RepID=UPI0007E598E1|nr:EF-hand domain-containing protein [Rhizobium aegyptiacum]